MNLFENVGFGFGSGSGSAELPNRTIVRVRFGFGSVRLKNSSVRFGSAKNGFGRSLGSSQG